MDADLIVVGSGPAGLATAIYARRAGLSALVLDKRSELDKACGEGLMPAGARLLEEMGVTVPAWGNTPFVGVRYLDGDTVAEGRFQNGHGLGVRRTALSEGLRGRALALGVDLRLGVSVTAWQRKAPGQVEVTTPGGSFTGRLLVAADGLHSAIRRQAGLEVAEAGTTTHRFGVRRHFAVAPWTDFVEVHWRDEVEAYVTPVGPCLVGVALLWRGKNANFESLLAGFPVLVERLRGAAPASAARGGGPFLQRVLRRYADDLALVGDAAGYLDPLTGEGTSLAFRSARALVETVSAGAPLHRYEQAYREITRSYYRMTGLLLRIAARPGLRRRVVAMLARRPELFSTMLAINSGEQPVTAIGVRGAVAMLTGLLR